MASAVALVAVIGVMIAGCDFDKPNGTSLHDGAALTTPEAEKVIVIEDQIPDDLYGQEAISAFRNGYSHMAGRRWYSAISAYDEATRVQPDSAGVYSARGTAHRYAGNHQEAISDYSRAIELEPNNASHWRNRAHAHNTAATPQPENAIADATRAIEIDPNHHMGYGHRAIAWTKLPAPDWRNALEDLDRSIERHPKHDPGAYEFRAWINEQLGDYAQAERDRQMAR